MYQSELEISSSEDEPEIEDRNVTNSFYENETHDTNEPMVIDNVHSSQSNDINIEGNIYLFIFIK